MTSLRSCDIILNVEIQKDLPRKSKRRGYKVSREISVKDVWMKIYVGNLEREVTEDDLRKVFGAFGEVTSVKIIKDKFTGQSREFGFIEMPNSPQAQSAINGLDGTDLKGRSLKVKQARPRRDPGRGGFDRSGPRGRRRF